MGVSTDGIVCYGICLDEDQELPWEECYDDIEEWWIREILGYENPFEIYDEDGEYIDGIKPPKEKFGQYYDAYFAFKKDNPLPVKLVQHCSDEYPMYILALPRTVTRASRGYPEPISTSPMLSQDCAMLVNFCDRHGIDIAEKRLGWWLASYWG